MKSCFPVFIGTIQGNRKPRLAECQPGEEDECELCVVDVLVAGEGFEPPTFGL